VTSTEGRSGKEGGFSLVPRAADHAPQSPASYIMAYDIDVVRSFRASPLHWAGNRPREKKKSTLDSAALPTTGNTAYSDGVFVAAPAKRYACEPDRARAIVAGSSERKGP